MLSLWRKTRAHAMGCYPTEPRAEETFNIQHSTPNIKDKSAKRSSTTDGTLMDTDFVFLTTKGRKYTKCGHRPHAITDMAARMSTKNEFHEPKTRG